MKPLLFALAAVALVSCDDSDPSVVAADRKLARENSALQAKVERLEKENQELDSQIESVKAAEAEHMEQQFAAERAALNTKLNDLKERADSAAERAQKLVETKAEFEAKMQKFKESN